MWYLQHILPLYCVQITVSQSSDICAGFSRESKQINGLSKDIILPCRIRTQSQDMYEGILVCPFIHVRDIAEFT